ncbi:MAG: plastocyanin/azurin family copper-binding protein [Gemmatimonadaceae bacterium]
MIPAHRSWPLLAAFVAIAACGGGGSGEPTSPTSPNNPGAPASTASVAMSTTSDIYGESNTFSPTSVTIARSGTVTWTNTTGTAHNVSFAGSGAPANIANHSSGSTARTFANAGTFSYQCTNHSGMTGSVTVQ